MTNQTYVMEEYLFIQTTLLLISKQTQLHRSRRERLSHFLSLCNFSVKLIVTLWNKRNH